MFIPKTINSIVCTQKVKIDPSTDSVCYKIDFNNGIIRDIFVNKPKYNKPKKLSIISLDNCEFINGYKVVKLVNGYYTYVREIDNMIMPYEFDIAFNFNEYGLAMVGKDASVSWINKDFKYVNSEGELKSCNDNEKEFDGWQGIFNFSNSDIPISRVYCGKEEYGKTVYLDSEGKIKKFYHYNGDIDKNIFTRDFYTGTDFTEKGYAKADNYILCENGSCISKDDIIKLGFEKCFIDFLFDEASYYLNELDKEKKLQKKL